MSSKDTGGEAFPCAGYDGPDNGEGSTYGMTLLDWFAGLAMQQMVAGEGARVVADRDERYDETNWAEVVVANAYEFADAMLAEKRRREAADAK